MLFLLVKEDVCNKIIYKQTTNIAYVKVNNCIERKSKFLYLDVYTRLHRILYLIRPNRGLRYERMLDPPRGPPPQAEPKPF